MPEVKTWPYLIGGPGDGSPLPPTHRGACEYLAAEDPFLERAALYHEVKLIVTPEELAVRCYVYAPGAPRQLGALMAWRAMARAGLAGLPTETGTTTE